MALKFAGGKATRLAGLPQLTPAITSALNEVEQSARAYKATVGNPRNQYAAGRVGAVAKDYSAKLQAFEGGGDMIFAVNSSKSAGAVLTSSLEKMRAFQRQYPSLAVHMKGLGMREVVSAGDKLLNAVNKVLSLLA